MSFNALTLQGLAASGCHLNVDAKEHTPLALQGLVNGVKQAGGYIIIRNAGTLNPLSAQGLASAGGKHVQLVV